MQLTQIIFTALAIPAVSAFAPPSTKGSSAVSTQLNVATGKDNLNGWKPDSSKFAFGLPGTMVSLKTHKLIRVLPIHVIGFLR